MTRLFLLTLMLIIGCSISAIHSYAQKNDDYGRELYGRLLDFVTNEPISDSCKVELLTKDSVVVAEGWVSCTFDGIKQVSNFTVYAPKPGDFILRVSAKGYHTLYKPISVKFYKREKSINLGIFPMQVSIVHNKIDLNEFVVKGTQLKFYFSNDTLIYNAEAFMTQKGFVLNDILNKMPGLDIRENGDIYSNGRKVDALLLNGKDFFNRDRRTLLDNMPAYAVKNIKIYDKTRDSLSLIKREREYEGFVMDVRLKKEYEYSSIANIDVGYGTNDRYFTKAIGLKYSSVHRISFYGFANNINRTELPTGNGESHGLTNNNGEYIVDRAGMSYNFENPRGTLSTEGDVCVAYVDGFSKKKNNRQNFFNTGDIFTRSVNNSNQYNLTATTNHKLYFLGNTPFDFTLTPSLKYSSVHGNETNSSAVFDVDIDSIWTDSWEDSLFCVNPTGAMRSYGINHDMMRLKNKGDAIELGIGVEKSIDVPHTEDELHLSGSFRYTSNKDKSYKQRNIDYLKTTSNQYLNEYIKNTTNLKEWKGNAVYDLVINDVHSINFDYHYTHTSLANDNPIYSLHKLAGWDNIKGNKMGMLPSEQLMLNILDRNSHKYWQKNNEQIISLKYNFEMLSYHKSTNFSFDIPVKIIHRKLNYRGLDCDTTALRKMIVPNLNFNFNYNFHNEKQKVYFFGLDYNLDHEMPAMYNLINITNDNNPLYITHGNPNLKNVRKHHVFTQFFYQSPMRNIHRFNLTFDKTDRQISVLQIFNKETGVTHSKPINVNGNYSLDMKFINEVFTGQSRKFQITNTLQLAGDRCIDQIRTDSEGNTGMSTVKNRFVNNVLGVKYMSKNTKIMLKGQGFFQFTHTTGNRQNFVTQNYYNYGSTFSAHLEMPKNFRLDTDYVLSVRRGLTYSEMNTTESLWNASLTKALGEKISLKLEAYDILNQRKLLVRRINAQCAEEVYYNAMRRYVMLHCIVRLNINHSKNGGQTANGHVERIY